MINPLGSTAQKLYFTFGLKSTLMDFMSKVLLRATNFFPVKSMIRKPDTSIFHPHCKRLYILIFLALWASLLGHAQSGKLFSVDVELSNSLIYDVFQDNTGIIWIATEDGLNRYDGSKFTIYKHNSEDATSLLNNYVRLLFEDRKGNLLIGFYNGLQVYDPSTDSFRKIPLIGNEGEHYDAHVITITQRQNGDILVGTSGYGIFSISFEEGVAIASHVQDFLPTSIINQLFEDQDRNLWVFSEDEGLFRIGQDGQHEHYSVAKGIPQTSITGLCQDREGNLYASSINHGLFVRQSSTNHFIPVPYPPSPNLPIATMHLGKNNELYLGTDGKGVKIYDLEKKSITEGNFNITTFDFEKAKVHAILEDRAGNLWLGIYQKGVMLLPASASNFGYVGYKSVKHNFIGSNAVLSILEDHKGTLWVGTDSDGLYGIGQNGEQKVHFERSQDPASVPSTIMTLFEDSERSLWVGSYLNGLAKVDRNTGKSVFVPQLLDHYGKKVERVYSLAEDRHKNLWIGTMGSGLFSINLATQKITHYPPIPTSDNNGGENMLHNGWINCLLPSSQEKLYIGTYDGIGCMDLKTKHFASVHGTNRLLKGHIIYSLYEDHKGTLWAGTSRGLIRLDPHTNEIKTYTMKDGLPSNVVCAIKGDEDNNLWISTNYGISKFNPLNSSFFNFYVNDGLQGNEFSKGTAFARQDGHLFFGGINGITHFNPAEIPAVIASPDKKLDVRITGFYLHNKAIKKGMNSGGYPIVDTTVMEAESFRLSHQDNSFSFELSAMEFANPARISYQYSLQGGDWVSLHPGTNTITFNDLASGSYHFRFRSKDYSSYSDVKEVMVQIYPAWYFSGWAKAAYALMLAIMVFLVVLQIRHRYRTRQKMQQHLHAKQMNDARLQFFINIAHEIRTPMTLIISPLRKLMSGDKNSERQKAYTTMHRNSERILLLINQLMDIRKIDKGQTQLKFQEKELVGFLKSLLSIFDEQAGSKNIQLQFHPQQASLPVWIDPVHFDKAILNVLSNAFKFTPENGRIELHVHTGRDESLRKPLQHYVELVVSDNGIGLEEAELEKIFECFYQARTAQNHFTEGTGIGLHLTRSIVELHHGSIRAANNLQGGGCRFIIRIPLGKEHLQPSDIAEPPSQFDKTESLVQATPLFTEEITAAKVKPKNRLRLLVVDDDEEIRKYICQELAAHYHMSESTNGKEALGFVLQNAPDLIISDVMMPEMDGITFCRKLKQNVNINHIPLVLLTAKSEEEDMLEGLGIGADAYLAKPFNMEMLLSTVQNLIQNRKLLRNNFNGSQQQQNKVHPVVVESSDEILMKKIMDLINQHMDNAKLNVEMIAREVGISRVHLHRKMKALTNQTTRDFIRNVRLQQAARLLSCKQLNISEVAYATGFSTLSSFSAAFKECYGVSPSEYMNTHLQGENKINVEEG
jgi:signal transduction histidine kinase/ligand-binding sensor domain-containing protein/DNA-binding response OmpR family regulator